MKIEIKNNGVKHTVKIDENENTLEGLVEGFIKVMGSIGYDYNDIISEFEEIIQVSVEDQPCCGDHECCQECWDKDSYCSDCYPEEDKELQSGNCYGGIMKYTSNATWSPWVLTRTKSTDNYPQTPLG